MHLKTSDQPVMNIGFGNITCNWGTHICGLYSTEAERDEIIFGYLHQGDVEGDFQLYCPSERTAENFTEVYYFRYPECAGHVEDSHQFSLASARELYFPDGTFSPLAMDKGLNEFYAESQKNGPRNIRATAEMAWALDAIPGKEHLMAYEARLNRFIPSKPWISICMYNLSKFDGQTIMQVLQTHPYVINGGIITQNSQFLDAETWLAKYSPEFL